MPEKTVHADANRNRPTDEKERCTDEKKVDCGN